MQLKYSITQVAFIQAPLHNLQSCHFLGNKEHRFLLAD